MMKLLARLLGLLSAFTALITLIKLPPGRLLYLYFAKITAGAAALWMTLLGGMGAFLGALKRDPLAMGSGLLGLLLNARHIRLVTAGHKGFEEAFGPQWEARIPPQMRGRLHRRRYRPLARVPASGPWQRDVAFGRNPQTDRPILADIWQPPQGVPRSGLAFIYLHGSGWHYLDKDSGTRPFFRTLAAQGHVVMDVAYSLAPDVDLVGMVGDVKQAIAWMKRNAGQYEIDPERVVLAGASAGGHLALLAAYTPNDPRLQPEDVDEDTAVRGVVSYYGVGDLAAAHAYLQRIPPAGSQMRKLARQVGLLPEGQAFVDGREMLVGLCRGTPEEVPEVYRRGSPLYHVGPHCPPTLLFHGEHDMGLEVSQSRALYGALRGAGVPVVYVEMPNSEHAFDLPPYPWAPAYSSALYDLERFLALLV